MGSPLIFPEGLRVLVVDDDATCLKVVGRMLQHCKYTVTLCNEPSGALNLLRDKRRAFDLVLSDVRMPGMDGFKLLEYIELELINLPVIMMSADSEQDMMMKSLAHGACFYLVKPVKMEQAAGMWQYVVRKRQERSEVGQAGRNPNPEGREVVQKEAVEEEGCAAVSVKEEGSWKKTKRGRKVNKEDQKVCLPKKPRVLWSTQLHDRFMIAVNSIGIDRAVPKKILEFMKVPGLSRENVASHLQKYRLYLKRVEEANLCAAVGAKPPQAVPKKSIFGSVPGHVMLHTRHQSSALPPFTRPSQPPLGALRLGLQPCTTAMSSPRPSMNHTVNPFQRLSSDQNLVLSGQAMPNSVGGESRPLGSPCLFLPMDSYINHHHQMRNGFPQHHPFPSTGNNAAFGHHRVQSFGNVGLATTETKMVGSPPPKGNRALSQDVPLLEFVASDYINVAGDVDDPELLLDETGLRTFNNLILPVNEESNSDHLKFHQDDWSDFFHGFIHFNGIGDLEDIFKQQHGENNGNLGMMET